MVHSKKQSPTENEFRQRHGTTTNQLIQAVSPFEELLPPKKDYPCCWDNDHDLGPFDEIVLVPPREVQVRQTRHEVTDRRRGGGPLADTRDDIPTAIVFRKSITSTTEDASQVSVDETMLSETRTLTPHPSFEKPSSITATEFHHLYRAAQDIDEQDWPSDEDGPRNGCGWIEQLHCGRTTLPIVNKKNLVTGILQDEGMEEFLPRRNSASLFEI